MTDNCSLRRISDLLVRCQALPGLPFLYVYAHAHTIRLKYGPLAMPGNQEGARGPTPPVLRWGPI
jgi:hypothetical protein